MQLQSLMLLRCCQAARLMLSRHLLRPRLHPGSQIETETDSGRPPSSLLHHFVLRFGVALSSLEHLSLIRLPTAAASAEELLLRAAVADELAAVEEQEALQSPDTSQDEDDSPPAAAAAPDEQQQQQQQRASSKNSGVSKRQKKGRFRGVGTPCSDALQLQQQLQGLYLTRCFFGSVFLPDAQKREEAPQKDSSKTTQEPAIDSLTSSLKNDLE
ncbi:hypothetical protein ACSSS7_004622 [Eimeria intestinalis]